MSKSNEPKPKVRLTGHDGNVFVLAGLVMRALKKAGHLDEAREFSAKLWACGNYDEALALMTDYVEVS